MRIDKNSVLGFSIFELLVVISIFSVVSILATQAVLLSLRGSRKTDANIKVRNDIEHSIAVMERHLRSASRISSCTSTRIDYFDSDLNSTYFECVSSGGYSYVASGSAAVKLTSPDTKVYCNNVFSCSLVTPLWAQISLGGSASSSLEETLPSYTSQTKVFLRN